MTDNLPPNDRADRVCRPGAAAEGRAATSV